jgi:hypothetical protein
VEIGNSNSRKEVIKVNEAKNVKLLVDLVVKFPRDRFTRNELWGGPFPRNLSPTLNALCWADLLRKEGTHVFVRQPCVSAWAPTAELVEVVKATMSERRKGYAPRRRPTRALSATSPTLQVDPYQDAIFEVLDLLSEKIPAAFEKLVERHQQVVVEDCERLVQLVEMKQRDLENSKVLLELSRGELHRARTKINELQGRINKLTTLKNRVIPETKVVVREPWSGGQGGRR